MKKQKELATSEVILLKSLENDTERFYIGGHHDNVITFPSAVQTARELQPRFAAVI